MYELAGTVGVDPSEFSLRELSWMSKGRDRSERYYIAWALGKAFGGGDNSEGAAKRKLPLGHKIVSWDEFKKHTVGYKDGSRSSKSG